MGVDVADRHRDPFRQAGPGGGLRREAAGPVAELADLVLELVGDERLEAGRQRTEELRRRVGAVLPRISVLPLVAGGAGVTDIGAAQLPHDPVGGLDPVLHPVVGLAVLLEQLQALGELPLRGDQAAVPRQPRLAPVRGQLVDPVGVGLGGVVLPELDVGMRPVGVPLDLVERGAVGEGGHHRAGGEVGRDPDHVGGIDTGRGDRRRHRDAQHVPVVVRHLQRPLRRQAGDRAGEPVLDHGVRVVVGRGAQLGTVDHANDHGPPRQRAVVHTDDVALRRPRLRHRGSRRASSTAHAAPSRGTEPTGGRSPRRSAGRRRPRTSS